MPRDYNRDPIEVEFTVRVYYYEPIPTDVLLQQINDLCDDVKVQEKVADAFGIVDQYGLDEISGRIRVK